MFFFSFSTLQTLLHNLAGIIPYKKSTDLTIAPLCFMSSLKAFKVFYVSLVLTTLLMHTGIVFFIFLHVALDEHLGSLGLQFPSNLSFPAIHFSIIFS